MTARFLPRPTLWLVTLLAVLGLNLGFLLFGLLVANFPRDALEEQVRGAFATDELIEEDWRRRDRRRGHNQYNDCLILQMALNRDPSVLREVVGPNLYLREGWYEQCRTLSDIVHNPESREDLVHDRYTRYWHGYVPATSLLLRVFSLRELRSGLKAGVYGSLLLLLVAAATDRRLFGFGASVAFAGATFWGLPYFGQSLGHAMGDALVVLAPAALLFFRNQLLREELLLPFAAVIGGLLVYFEFLTGQLPVGAALIFMAVYLAARVREGANAEPVMAWRLAIWALVALGIGSVATVVLKQILVLVVLGPEGINSFLSHLDRYSGAGGPGPLTYRLGVLGDLIASGSWHRSGGETGTLLLYAISGTAWMVVLGSALWHRGSALADACAFGFGAAIIVGWVFLLPEHTAGHLGFMSRMLFVPVALGFAALIWRANQPIPKRLRNTS